MPARLTDTQHAMVIRRSVFCVAKECYAVATYDVSLPEYYLDGRPKGIMGDWEPMCYVHAKAATAGEFRRNP